VTNNTLDNYFISQFYSADPRKIVEIKHLSLVLFVITNQIPVTILISTPLNGDRLF